MNMLEDPNALGVVKRIAKTEKTKPTSALADSPSGKNEVEYQGQQSCMMIPGRPIGQQEIITSTGEVMTADEARSEVVIDWLQANGRILSISEDASQLWVKPTPLSEMEAYLVKRNARWIKDSLARRRSVSENNVYDPANAYNLICRTREQFDRVIRLKAMGQESHAVDMVMATVAWRFEELGRAINAKDGIEISRQSDEIGWLLGQVADWIKNPKNSPPAEIVSGGGIKGEKKV